MNKTTPETQPENFQSVAEINLDEVAERARSQAERSHKWVQRGVYIVCTECEFEHAVHIGVHKLLQGHDEEGAPIIVDKVLTSKKALTD